MQLESPVNSHKSSSFSILYQEHLCMSKHRKFCIYHHVNEMQNINRNHKMTANLNGTMCKISLIDVSWLIGINWVLFSNILQFKYIIRINNSGHHSSQCDRQSAVYLSCKYARHTSLFMLEEAAKPYERSPIRVNEVYFCPMTVIPRWTVDVILNFCVHKSCLFCPFKLLLVIISYC